MADDKDSKQSNLSTSIAVLEHRVTKLEDTPPRVNSLEQTVGQLEVQFKTMNKDIGEIKEDSKDTHSLVLKLGEDVRKLFFIGVVVASIASCLLVGLKLYDTWLSIQERRVAEVQDEARR